MKRTIKTFIYTLAILLASCADKADYGTLLKQSDSLMESRPDSALTLLDGIPTKELKTDADRAYYALLLTQARDKNYITQRDDSLIQSAMQYYNQYENTAMQARGYYLWGGFYRDKNKQAEAIEKYLIAATFAEKANNKALLGRIYNNAGHLYYFQKLYEEADSLYRKVEQIGIQLNDVSLHTEALLMQGKVKSKQNDYPQAEKKLLQAQTISKNFESNKLQANIARTLSLLYSRTKDKAKALKYAKQNISFLKDTKHCYYAFFTLGEAYFQTNQYDSATYYLNKSLNISDYGIKADAYMRLADIAKIQGETAISLKMELLHSAYRDSVEQNSQRSKILKAEHKVKEQIQHTHYEKAFNERILITIVSFLICATMFFLWFRRKHHIQEREQLARENGLRKSYVLQKELHAQKEAEIKALQDQIVQQHISEEQKQTLEIELINLHEQYTDSIKKIRKYSDVIQKIDNILTIYREKKVPKDFLDENDWARLLAEIDKKGVINRICETHGLSEIEYHLCTLLLLDYSVADMGRIIQRDRVSVYRIERSIAKKMGKEYQTGELQKQLKNMVNDCTSK